MSTHTHTPGKWHTAAVSERSWHVGVYDESGTEVALVKVKSALHSHRRDADARLIAAAPEILAALRQIELAANTVNGCYTRNPGNFAVALMDMVESAEAARVVIAKANASQS